MCEWCGGEDVRVVWREGCVSSVEGRGCVSSVEGRMLGWCGREDVRVVWSGGC